MSNIFRNLINYIKKKSLLAVFSGSVEEYVKYKEELDKKYKK